MVSYLKVDQAGSMKNGTKKMSENIEKTARRTKKAWKREEIRSGTINVPGRKMPENGRKFAQELSMYQDERKRPGIVVLPLCRTTSSLPAICSTLGSVAYASRKKRLLSSILLKDKKHRLLNCEQSDSEPWITIRYSFPIHENLRVILGTVFVIRIRHDNAGEAARRQRWRRSENTDH